MFDDPAAAQPELARRSRLDQGRSPGRAPVVRVTSSAAVNAQLGQVIDRLREDGFSVRVETSPAAAGVLFEIREQDAWALRACELIVRGLRRLQVTRQGRPRLLAVLRIPAQEEITLAI
jgi:hypothetical protein